MNEEEVSSSYVDILEKDLEMISQLREKEPQRSLRRRQLEIIGASVKQLRLLQTFAGVLPCPPGKNSYARHFKEKHGKLYIVGKLHKCRLRKKNVLPVFLIPQKKIAKLTANMTMRHSIKHMN